MWKILSLLAAANAWAATIEMERSLPGLRELIAVKSENGNEELVLNTNRRWPKRREIGLFQRRSANFASIANIFSNNKSKEAAGVGLPEVWRVHLNGKEIPYDPAVIEKVWDELKSEKEWTPVSTVTVKIDAPDAIFTYKEKGKPPRTEAKPMMTACPTIDGKIACETNYGFIFLNL